MTIWNTPAEKTIAGMTGNLRSILCLRAIVQSNIPDLIEEKPQTVTSIANEVGFDQGSLERVMNYLADEGFFNRDSEDRYSNTEVTRLFRSDIPNSLRTYLLLRTENSILASWMLLPEVLKTGQHVFAKANGKPIFEYLRDNPEFADLFNDFMNKVFGGEGKCIAEGFNFGQFRSVADLGGGLGHVLAEILQRHPDLSGGLFDLPSVAEAARAFLKGQPIADRAKVIGGNIFDSVPEGFDAYFIKSVLHDWGDEDVKKILVNCRKVMTDDTRLLIAELVPSTTKDLYPDSFIDLEMMVLAGGKERSLEQFDVLLNSADLSLVQCHEIPASSFKIIEAKVSSASN